MDKFITIAFYFTKISLQDMKDKNIEKFKKLNGCALVIAVRKVLEVDPSQENNCKNKGFENYKENPYYFLEKVKDIKNDVVNIYIRIENCF